MPDGILPDEGIGVQLRRILDPASADHATWRLILFVNDITPDADTVLADLTEATWAGYSFVTMIPGNWTTPEVDTGCATSTYGTTPLTWYVTGGPLQTNYGYAMIDPGAGVIRFVQRFEPADIQPVVVGARVILLPTYTLTSAACPG